jgi:hypothetical protein
MALVAMGAAPGSAHAQVAGAGQPDWLSQLPEVAATVGGQPISSRRVIAHLDQTVPHFRQFERAAIERLLAEACEHLVRRELVLTRLLDGDNAIGPGDVRLERDRIGKELASRGIQLADQLRTQGMDETAYDRELLWKLAWQQYLDAELTSEAVRHWYEKYHFRFDGSTVRVDQILWRWPVPRDAEAEAALRRESRDVAGRLRKKELEWDAAVRKWSVSPLARLDDRPDMGWIGYHGPMPESFAAAAFALQPGEISLPVETRLGLHIIQCLEVRTGERSLAESSDEVRTDMSRGLFERLAGEAAVQDLVVRNSGFPHAKPVPAEDGMGD